MTRSHLATVPLSRSAGAAQCWEGLGGRGEQAHQHADRHESNGFSPVLCGPRSGLVSSITRIEGMVKQGEFMLGFSATRLQ